MLEVISEDHTDELSPPAGPRAWPVVGTLARSEAVPLATTATSPPASRQHAHHSVTGLASVADSPLTSLSLSMQYLDPRTPASPRYVVRYEDTIMLASPAGANKATSGLPPGRGEILPKWVFKTKVHGNASLRNKVRRVVHGFEQKEVLDY